MPVPETERRSDERRAEGPGAPAAARKPGLSVAGLDAAPPAALEDVVALTEVRLRETLAEIDRLKQGAQSVRVRIEAELQVQRRRAANAEERARQLEEALQQTREELETQRITCAELTTVLRATEHRLTRLEENLGTRGDVAAALRDAQAAELERVRGDREQLDGRLADAKRELAATRERFAAEVAALAEARAALAAEVDSLRHRLSERGEECNRLAAEVQRANEAAGALEGQVRHLNAVQNGAVHEIGELQSRIVQLEAALATAREHDAARSEDARRLTVRAGVLERELAQQRDDNEVLQRERAELQTLADALLAESEQLRREMETGQRTQQQALEQCRVWESRVDELERALVVGREHEAALQKTVNELQELLQKEQAGAAALRSELQGQARARQSIEIDLAEARARATELQLKVQSDTQQHLKQLAKTNDRLRILESERESLREQVANLLAAKERLERENEQLRRRVSLERQQEEMARLRARLEEVAWLHPEARRQAAANGGGAGVAAVAAVAARPSTAPVGEPADLPIVAIGASTGGPAALGEILSRLPGDFPACVLIVQHMPPGYTAELAYSLDQRCALRIVEAQHGDPLQPGTAYIAPGGHHMEVRGGVIHLNTSAPVNKHRPSVDVLYASLEPVAKRVYAMMLSGMGHDGVAGLGRLRAAGAKVAVQDEASSVVWGMPGAAVKSGCASLQLTPVDMAEYLIRGLSSGAIGEAAAGEADEAEAVPTAAH
jgi:chemotaxis response regulator CheB